MNRFFRVYVLGLAFVVVSTAPAGLLLLLGGWLWTQALVLTVAGLVIPPCRPLARWCFAGADLCIRPVVWAYGRYDQIAFPSGESPANLQRSESATAENRI